MAAAVRLAEHGAAPILLETRKRLGGRATSFEDPRSGEQLDNCQHVVMGCCTGLLDFYERIGAAELLDWTTTTWWANPPYAPAALAPSVLPAPMHLALGFMRLGFLSRGSKRSIARALRAILRLGLAGRQAWENRTFESFLNEHAQTSQAIELFWRPVVVSACNAHLETVSAAAALQVMQEGFLAHRFASAMGLARVPLERLYERVPAIIENAGGEVRLRTSVQAITFDGSRVTGVVTGDDSIAARAVIATVPFDRLQKLCSETLCKADDRLQQLDAFDVSPILGVHLFFDQQIMTRPHLVLPGRETHWLFDKGRANDGSFHVHAVISAAASWMALDEETIVQRVLDDVYWALPGARGLEPTRVRAVKEKRATFAPLPGVEAIRPSASAGLGVGNLYLAGDWCASGWPATMEGAVRSGERAAAAVLGLGGVVADLPVATISRWLGLR